MEKRRAMQKSATAFIEFLIDTVNKILDFAIDSVLLWVQVFSSTILCSTLIVCRKPDDQIHIHDVFLCKGTQYTGGICFLIIYASKPIVPIDHFNDTDSTFCMCHHFHSQ